MVHHGQLLVVFAVLQRVPAKETCRDMKWLLYDNTKIQQEIHSEETRWCYV